MKILLSHELFMPDFAGGGEKLAFELARNLKERGVEVSVITTGNPKVDEFEGIDTHRIPVNRFLMNLKAREIVKAAEGCDLIQCCTYNAAYPSLVAGRRLDIPVVCMVFGAYGKRWIEMRGQLAGRLSLAAERFILSRPYDSMIFLSEYSLRWAKESGIRPGRTAVINPGVDTSEYHSGKKEPFVLFSGRFARQKGVDTVIAVAKKLPKTRFVMMGWGEEEGRLRKMAPENVEFSNLRLKDGKPFYDMYAKAMVFFLPSVAESFGFTIVEAMASGCAIVSTIDLDYRGIKADEGDDAGMARAISGMMEDAKGTKKMGDENLTLAKAYNWEAFTDKLIKEYHEVLKENGA